MRGVIVILCLLHYIGLGGVTVACAALGLYGLAIVDGAIFLLLIWLERNLFRAPYTRPMPVWLNTPAVLDLPERACVTPQAPIQAMPRHSGAKPKPEALRTAA